VLPQSIVDRSYTNRSTLYGAVAIARLVGLRVLFSNMSPPSDTSAGKLIYADVFATLISYVIVCFVAVGAQPAN